MRRDKPPAHGHSDYLLAENYYTASASGHSDHLEKTGDIGYSDS